MKKKSLLLTAVATLGFTAATIAQTVPSYVPTNGLVGWWPFNGNANDESGGGNNGTVNGATLTSDRFNVSNKAYYFNGSNTITIPHNTLLNSHPITISAWIQTDVSFTSGGGFILNKYVNGSWNGWNIYLQINNSSSSTIIPAYMRSSNPCNAVIEGYAICNNPVGMNYTGNINNSNWHHVVFRVDSNGGVLFFDGVQVAQQVWIGAPGSVTTSTQLVIGSNFKGKIDDIGIWSGSLSQQQINNLYQGCSNPIANITPQGSTTICSGGSVILNATSGSGYTYQWYRNGTIINNATSSSYSASIAGNYSVIVTSNGCSSTSSQVTVTVNNTPSISITPSGPTTFCSGGFVILNASGGSTYQWNNGSSSSSINVSQSGTYTVVGTSNGCSATSSQTVVVNPIPNTTLSGLSNFTNYYSNPIILTGSPGGGTYGGSGVSGNSFNPSAAGLGLNSAIYTYTSTSGCTGVASQSTIVYDTLGNVCTTYDTVTTYISVTDTLFINTSVSGINPPNNVNTIKVFPNPASTHITIDYGNFAIMNGYQLVIENSIGQQVFQTNINQQSDYLSLATWGGNGLYFVHIIDAQGNTIDIRKIVLQ